MNNKKIGDVLALAKDASMAYQMHNGVTSPYIIREMDYVWFVSELCCAVSKTKNSNSRLFSIKEDKRSGAKYIHAGKIGSLIAEFMNGFDSHVRNCFNLHKFPPEFEIFYCKLKEHGLNECLVGLQYYRGDDAVRLVDLLNGFVDDIRREAKSKSFKESVRRYYRSSDENYKELLKYGETLLRRYKRLFVFRMDYGYVKPPLWPSSGAPVDCVDVKKHRAILLKNTNKSSIKNLVGYAWKLEYGSEKYFQLHVMYFFEVCDQENGEGICEELGDFWVNKVTGGKGLCYDCSNFKDGYKKVGTGIINNDGVNGMTALKEAALYMTKSDYLIRLAAPDKGRSFGKGGVV